MPPPCAVRNGRSWGSPRTFFSFYFLDGQSCPTSMIYRKEKSSQIWRWQTPPGWCYQPVKRSHCKTVPGGSPLESNACSFYQKIGRMSTIRTLRVVRPPCRMMAGINGLTKSDLFLLSSCNNGQALRIPPVLSGTRR